MKSDFAMGTGVEVETAIAEREAQLIAKPIRVEPLAQADISVESKALMAELRSAFGGSPSTEDDISSTSRVSLRHPELFRHQYSFISFLLTKGVLPPRDREIAAIRMLWLCGAGNPYGEHVALAKTCGISEDEVIRITRGSEVAGWSAHDQAVLAAVEQLYDRQLVDDEVWDVLAKTWSEPQLLEFTILVGQYFGSAVFHNSLRTRMGENNRGLRQHLPGD